METERTTEATPALVCYWWNSRMSVGGECACFERSHERLAGTDSLFALTMEIVWIIKGGGNVAAAIRRYSWGWT